MSEKAEQKKEYIIECAKRIFAKKGFKSVTMKDIVSACNISRGGVYLYFSSTNEIFEAVLQMEENSEQYLVPEGITTACSAREQMGRFLHEQKKELLNPSNSLIVATYEYLFMQSALLDKAETQSKFNRSADQLTKLIQHGVDRGEFRVEPCVAAQNIVLLLEGLRVTSTVLALDEAFLDRQMSYVLSMLEGGTCNEA